MLKFTQHENGRAKLGMERADPDAQAPIHDATLTLNFKKSYTSYIHYKKFTLLKNRDNKKYHVEMKKSKT